MKKALSILIAMVLVLGLMACGGQSAPAADSAAGGESPAAEGETAAAGEGAGKVAIITTTVSANEEDYRMAQKLAEQYPGRIVHETWPDNTTQEQEQMISIVNKIANNQEVKAIVFAPAMPGTNAAIDKLKEVRDDMLVMIAMMGENPPDVATRVDFGMMPNEQTLGGDTARQAHKLGAKTMLYYSFPRFMSDPIMIGKRDDMRDTAEELGMTFVELTAPDPASDAGLSGMQQFMFEDIPKQLDKYGADTAVWGANCGMQVPIIQTVIDKKAIMPVQCCPSPLHGFPSALGLQLEEGQIGDVDFIIEETRKKLDEAGMLGRISTWPVPSSMMSNAACTRYAIDWIDGKITARDDTETLRQYMSDFAGVDIDLSPYVENGTSYDNIVLINQPFMEY